jgi:hypothetical protein
VRGRERKTYGGGRKCVLDGERARNSKTIERVYESVRGRERKIERGGRERGKCRKER